VAAVGGDHVARAHGRGLASVAIANDGGDALRIWSKLIMSVPKRRSAPSSSARCFNTGSSKLCEINTRSQGLNIADPVIQVCDVVCDLLAGQRLHGHDRPVLDELILGSLPHDLLERPPSGKISMLRWVTCAARGWIAVPR
jgi:hypothetical protein